MLSLLIDTRCTSNRLIVDQWHQWVTNRYRWFSLSHVGVSKRFSCSISLAVNCLHTGLCKFAQSISANFLSVGERKYLKLGEMSSLPISYNITIFWLYQLNSFRFIFSLCDSENWSLIDVIDVHCCDPALSVLVMLVSRNVFHVVSALQSIVSIHFVGWLDLL